VEKASFVSEVKELTGAKRGESEKKLLG